MIHCRMCVGPSSVSREEFFEITSSLLKESPEASDICVIADAFVLFQSINSIDLFQSLQ